MAIRFQRKDACIRRSDDASEEDQVQVIGLNEARRHRPLHAVFETGEELFLGTCDSRGVGGIGVFVNTHLAMNIDSYESSTTRLTFATKEMWLNPSYNHLVAYAPTSSYQEEELEAFYMDLKRFYREDHTFVKVIVGDFNAKMAPEVRLKSSTSGLTEWNGISRVKSCPSSLRGPTPYMVTRNSRSPLI
ncbi:hypothetical protein V3C99_011283, partial [Haemonchus contortus]|uniref:Endo/exonuclease/phosphatase domain-containing protein n=1 Tax=Haemonchus contortus TaxID=6289 RepID=A0A7I4Y7Z4_HAECO